MLQWVALSCAGVAAVAGVLLLGAIDRLVGSRAGRIAVFLGVVVLPLLALGSGSMYAVKASSSTTFCLSCHEMDAHGKSLFIDDPMALPAVHYQKRLIDRDETCYACHTDYAIFGDIKAKMNGLKHVWVHYLGDPPEPEALELYSPYPNYNCLHCHDDARSFLEASGHEGKFAKMQSGALSCLKCHGEGHALDQVEEGNFWQAQ
jgi:cytochrome c-type protein NapC